MVNMADFAVARAPDALATIGIGSCVAVCLYDAKEKVGGLAHIMLPWNRENDQSLAGKFADTGIAGLIRLMVSGGASPNSLTAKITGGASVFSAGEKQVITVGKNNIEAVKTILAGHKIRVAAEDTGGTLGRGLVFHTQTGVVEVTVLSRPPELRVLR